MTNDSYQFPQPNGFRLSDAERTDAINQLAMATGEGRLSMEEFERRADVVVHAETRRELVSVFSDIPVNAVAEPKEFSRADIEKARASGRKPKLATALIGSGVLNFVGVAGVIVGASQESVGAALLGGIGALMLIPILWILLYVAKIGPDSWHVPSPKQIERQQAREIRALTARQRAEQKQLESQMWAQRRQQAGELTGDALKLAKEAIDRIQKR